jgi:gliding motility-associated-like protein
MPNLTVGPNVSICPGSTSVLNASGATQYHWQPSTGLSNTFLATTIASPSVTTTYTVTTGSLGGCQAMDSIIVSISPTGTADAGPDKMTCIGGSVDLQATGMTACTWTPATGLSATNTFSITANPSATTVYYVTGPDLNGCQITDSVVVYILPPPVANAGPDLTICSGDNADLIGSGGNSFHWEPAIAVTNANSYHGTSSPLQSTTYTLTVSNGGTCISTDSMVVTVLPKPNVISTGNKSICPGGSVQLGASGAVSYQWNTDPSLSILNIPNPTASPSQQTTYTVTGTDANGCKDTAQVIVYHKLPVEVKALPGGTVCPGTDLQLFAEGALSYEWIPSTGLDNPYIPSPVASPPYSITYKVKGTDGCTTDSTYVQVTVNNAPGVIAGADKQTFANNPVEITAQGTGTFLWSPQELVDCATCQTTNATVSETTTFVVTNYNDAGCKTEDTIVVYVGCSNDLIYVPNAFSPNGDGKNERFYIRTKGLKHFNYFKIYTRTGQCVFETNDVANGWDGTFNGLKLPPGVFSYYAEVVCSDNQKIQLTGNVTLIR